MDIVEGRDYKLICGDCLQVIGGMEDNSVNAVIIDPPYYKAVDCEWDRQWNSASDYLDWMRHIISEVFRVLKANGSFYCFSSPDLSWHIEGIIREKFNVLNNIRWERSGSSTSGKMHLEDLRSFLSPWESIIFSEHYGADNFAKGETGYQRKCDELRGFIFEPIRAYLDGERIRAGVQRSQIVEYFSSHGWPKYVTERHSFSVSQFELPTEENYKRLRQCLEELNGGGKYLLREYEDLRREYEDLRREYEDLRREYEDLRREYEDLRRPFNSKKGMKLSDIFYFNPHSTNEKNRHPTQKPESLIVFLVEMSTNPGDLVADFFAGSFTTGVACLQTGRKFIGIERERQYFDIGVKRMHDAAQHVLLPGM